MSTDHTIVRAAIYPPIGVCRVGNSPDEYYVGPEVFDPEPPAMGDRRDDQGRLKRQVARFRCYGLDALGRAVRELTLGDAGVDALEWRVHLVNQKAAWYQFQLAGDIPEFKAAHPSWRRNAKVLDRSTLVIDAGPDQIAGCDECGRALVGRFIDRDVYLGELRTDDAGRLLVFGGRGVSASHDGSPAVTFANNEGWHDDTSDGPVTATVRFEGRDLPVAPAWVVSAPPDYAPLQKSVRTMWDLMRDVAISGRMLAAPAQPSFVDDIAPIFQRMADLQWVNAGFAAGFGWKGMLDIGADGWIDHLSHAETSSEEERRTLANQFRRPDVDSWSPKPWPWLYGDAMSLSAVKTYRQNSALTTTQLKMLDQWVVGEFVPPPSPATEPARSIDDLPVADQPDMLTRAAMDFCLADAFHPGCEMTWPMRTTGMYMSAFRLRHAPHGWTEPDYGPRLTKAVLDRPDGPLLGGQLPGGITRWMATPWQTDTASCRSGYDTTYDPYVPTFWPARVPNEVMTPAQYEVVTDESVPLGERMKTFAQRAQWLAPIGLNDTYVHQINEFIAHFDAMAVVERRDPEPTTGFPTMQVGDRPIADSSGPERHLLAERLDTLTDLTGIDKVRRFVDPAASPE